MEGQNSPALLRSALVNRIVIDLAHAKNWGRVTQVLVDCRNPAGRWPGAAAAYCMPQAGKFPIGSSGNSVGRDGVVIRASDASASKQAAPSRMLFL